MARTSTSETPPRARRAASPSAAKPPAPRKNGSTPRSARSATTTPPQTEKSKPSVPTLLSRFDSYLVAKPPAKRALANGELEQALDGIGNALDDLAKATGPILAFEIAALVEAVSQGYNATGSGKPIVPLVERYERLLLQPMKPTSRRAWAAYFLHADLEAARSILERLRKERKDPVALALGLAALHQATAAHYAANGTAE